MSNSEKLRVVVLCSGGDEILRYLCADERKLAAKYEIVGVLADRPTATGLTYASGQGIQVIHRSFERWRTCNSVEPDDLERREGYFQHVLELINPLQPDCIILSDFGLQITDPLLSHYEGRIIGIHPLRATVNIITGEPGKGPVVLASSSRCHGRAYDVALNLLADIHLREKPWRAKESVFA